MGTWSSVAVLRGAGGEAGKVHLATQMREPVWAAAAGATSYGRIAQASGLELSEFHVECRATICHLRFVFASDEYRRSTGDTAVAKVLNELPGFHTSG